MKKALTIKQAVRDFSGLGAKFWAGDDVVTLVNGWVPVSIMVRWAGNATITLATWKSLAFFAIVVGFLVFWGFD